MNSKSFLSLLRDSFQDLCEPILYMPGREKSFQAALYASIKMRIHAAQDVAEDLVLEQEVTKSLRLHAIVRRPDLILHVPFESGRTTSRGEGNLVSLEIKVNAGLEAAHADYDKLARMCEMLHYEIGVFVNVGAEYTHWTTYTGRHKDRLKGFAVRLANKVVLINEEPHPSVVEA
jgi:hypothetical protein